MAVLCLKMVTAMAQQPSGTMNRDSGKSKKDKTTVSPKQGSTSPSPLTDAQFVKEAATAGMMEVQMGTMGKSKATNSRVKTFSDMMVQDHTKANDELKSIAHNKNITLPPEPKTMDNMDNLSGMDWDKHYMDMMVKDHKKAVALFEKQSTAGRDADLKAFAKKTLPTLKMHLDSAQSIQSSLKVINNNMGEQINKQ